MTWVATVRPVGPPVTPGVSPGYTGYSLKLECAEMDGTSAGFRWAAFWPVFHPHNNGMPHYTGIHGTTQTYPLDYAGPPDSPTYINQGIGFYMTSQISALHGALGTASSGSTTSLVDTYSEGIDLIEDDPQVSGKARVHITGGGTQYSKGAYVSFSGVGGMTEINGLVGKISAKHNGGDWIRVDIDVTGFSAYTSGGTVTTDLNHALGKKIMLHADSQANGTARTVETASASTITWAEPIPTAVSNGTKYDLDRSDRFHIDGVELLGPTASFPFWNRYFVDIDSAGFTGKNVKTSVSDPVTWGVPFEVEYRLLKGATVQDPAGTLSKNALTGQVEPLVNWPNDEVWQTGTYATWNAFVSIDGGSFVHVARFYWRDDAGESLGKDVLVFDMELIGTPLSTRPARFRYRECSVFDGTAWHRLPHFRLGNAVSHAGDNAHGVHIGDHTVETPGDALVYSCGHATDVALGKKESEEGHHMWVGFEYQKSSTPGAYSALTYRTSPEFPTTTQSLGVTYTGPTWGTGPLVCQDYADTRSFFVMRPDASEKAVISYKVTDTALHTFRGDFSHWNAAGPNGAGEIVSLYVNAETTPRWTATIPPTSPASSDAPFDGGAGHTAFDVADIDLTDGDRVHFTVEHAAEPFGFNETAFRLTDIEYKAKPVGTQAATFQSLDARVEFRGADILIAFSEPDFSAEYQPDQPGTINTGLDPLVRSFSIDVIDPDTGVVLREVRGLTERQFRYTRDMNEEDHRSIFTTRGADRSVGFQVWMESVADRTSARRQITVKNELPAVPAGVTLTSAPGNALKGLKATVHGEVAIGQSSDDPDFVTFVAWASETQGFTPSRSDFVGAGSRGSRFLSFPAPSDTTMYVRVGAIDEFHGPPEQIESPESALNLLAEQSVQTFDAASLPIETDDIAANAVTGFNVIELNGVGEQTIDVDVRGGKLSVVLFTILTLTDDNETTYSCEAEVERVFSPVSVKFFDGVDFTDETTDAETAGGSNDVGAPAVAGEELYLGNTFPWGDSLAPIVVTYTGTPFTVGSSFAFDYWNGTAWVSMSVTDGTAGLTNAGPANWTVTVPQDWQPTTVDGAGPYYFLRVTQSGTAQTPQDAIDRLHSQRQIIFNDTSHSGGNDVRQKVTTLVDAAEVSQTQPTETLIVRNLSVDGVATLRSKLVVNAGKDAFA